MIQWAARLRVGADKTAVIVLCREAIKNNNTGAVFDIIKNGKPPT